MLSLLRRKLLAVNVTRNKMARRSLGYRVAYGKPKKKAPVAGGLVNFGVKVVQVVYLRPPAWGFRKGSGKK